MKPRLTRRDVLLTGAAAALPIRAIAATPDLHAAPAAVRLTPESGPMTPVWAYGGTVPGPELRLKQGQTLSRVFRNGLPQPSSVHWHGIRIANAMDGVAGLTQPAVAPGDSFAYDFAVPDAGTYWYHPHNRTWEQLARGLYGPLIVEEADPPTTDHDLTLMLDDWRLADTGALHDSFGRMHDWSHAGRIGNWVTVNGDPEWRAKVKTGDRLRLRLINAANARVFQLGLQGMTGWTVALDGQPLAAPEPVERLALAPAQRADLIVDVTSDEGLIYSIERGDGYVVASFPATGQQRPARPAPVALPPNALRPLGDLTKTRKAVLDMDGGAMGGMAEAKLNGRTMGIRDLVQEGMAWAFNGVSGMPETPLLDATRGETLRIAMENRTRWPHAMHLHGHHFREVVANAPAGPWHDTLLIQPGQTREIAFVADNPGDWLLHCHMVEHSASGMMTWLRVG